MKLNVRFLSSAFFCFGLAAASLPGARANAATPTAGTSESTRLYALFARDWEWRLRDSPTQATYYGDSRYNDRWTDFSPAAIEARRAHHRQLDADLKAVDRGRLNEAERLDYDLFKQENDAALAADRFPEEYLLLSQMSAEIDDGYMALASITLVTPFNTVKDYRDFLERMRRFPALIEQHLGLLRRGLAAGVTQPRAVVRLIPKVIDEQLTARPEDSPVYQAAFKRMPATLDAATQAALRAEARALLSDAVMPALRSLRAYLVGEYLPRARESIGLGSLPNGAAWYAEHARAHTTTNMTPDEIHQLGLDEVKRIRGEMERVMHQTGFKGDLPAFFRFLRTDKRFYFTRKDQLVLAYRDIAKRLDPELPKLIRTLPRLTYGVDAMPAYMERTMPTGYYWAGSSETGRAGRFFANTYDLQQRPSWEMEALTLHEAVPGHHLQVSLAQELTGIPPFRRWRYVTAFGEGWGLYCESLGGELGLYQDPYAKFGQLTFEIWRAIRLVVDTGMHAKGWTREQAIQYFLDNTGKTRAAIEVEIDRYLAMPGQALAYKIGELTIKRLRAEATSALGARFSLRDFHDVVLGAGSVPLDVLETRVHAWVKKQVAAPN